MCDYAGTSGNGIKPLPKIKEEPLIEVSGSKRKKQNSKEFN